MGSKLLQKLVNKTITKQQLYEKLKQNYDLLPEILNGISSSKPAIRYNCAKVLMNLSKEEPDKLYSHMDFFIKMLDSEYSILTWNAIITLANLTKVNSEKKFDLIFDKYYNFLDDEYMVTVANVVGNSGKIALAKPYLTQKITDKLLKVENISIKPHLSKEFKRVIPQHAIKTFDIFFPQIEQKNKVISFVKKHLDNPRESLQMESKKFSAKWA